MKATKKNLKAVLETHKKTYGNVSLTCEAHNISRDTFYRWKKKYQWFADEVENNNEASVDYVESKLMQNIGKNKEASIFFYLKTKGKHRGYIERTETVSKEVDEFDQMTDEELDEELAKNGIPNEK